MSPAVQFPLTPNVFFLFSNQTLSFRCKVIFRELCIFSFLEKWKIPSLSQLHAWYSERIRLGEWANEGGQGDGQVGGGQGDTVSTGEDLWQF